MRTAIVTDSTAYIPEEIRRAENIHMVPLQVTFGNESFAEEEELHVDDFYKKAEQELPKTSQPPIGEFVTKYQELAKEYDEIVSIHLSSGISGTFQGAQQANELVKDVEVFAFDTEISCAMQGFYALKAAELSRAGADAATIIQALNEMKKTMRAYFMVEDLNHLRRGGRLSNAQAIVGGLLQIKPLLHFQDKLIVPFEKIRTRKKAMKRIEGMLGEDVQAGIPLKAAIIHANRPDDAQAWYEELHEQYPEVEFVISYFGPVIGTHLGEGSMGLGWVRK
ncbi:DegV domain-containing protein [Planococcus massiliensis]|uniref:DegV domain-containing protein n=1 Tax=Planococcus massiliensis TaxID=1499687 RepID=A0A098ELR3_9BACL|nr:MULTISPECIES: DegV family protein [Planococcus]MCJ1906982.1 DegV family protein [Planococcus ruber]CEG22216.1 DegV domain-containing protein [Planococcus massiliensis]